MYQKIIIIGYHSIYPKALPASVGITRNQLSRLFIRLLVDPLSYVRHMYVIWSQKFLEVTFYRRTLSSYLRYQRHSC